MISPRWNLHFLRWFLTTITWKYLSWDYYTCTVLKKIFNFANDRLLYKSVVLSVWACLVMTYNLIISVNAIEKWICFAMILSTWLSFFQVRWGSGSIVSVRWVHLDNPRLWECGNGWECNIQTASTLPHQSDHKSSSMIWCEHPFLILHCSSALPVFILVHSDLSIGSDSAGLLKVSYQTALKYPHLPFHHYLNAIIPTKTFCLSPLKLLFTHVLWHRT